jgi:hypothetical protein
MASTVVIAAGHVTDEAQVFLKAHGATLEYALGLEVIQLPVTAMVEKQAHDWHHTIAFYGPDGEYEDSYCDIELDVNAYETVIVLKQGY